MRLCFYILLSINEIVEQWCVWFVWLLQDVVPVVKIWYNVQVYALEPVDFLRTNMLFRQQFVLLEMYLLFPIYAEITQFLKCGERSYKIYYTITVSVLHEKYAHLTQSIESAIKVFFL